MEHTPRRVWGNGDGTAEIVRIRPGTYVMKMKVAHLGMQVPMSNDDILELSAKLDAEWLRS
jgi:hypothetical protein